MSAVDRGRERPKTHLGLNSKHQGKEPVHEPVPLLRMHAQVLPFESRRIDAHPVPSVVILPLHWDPVRVPRLIVEKGEVALVEVAVLLAREEGVSDGAVGHHAAPLCANNAVGILLGRVEFVDPAFAPLNRSLQRSDATLDVLYFLFDFTARHAAWSMCTGPTHLVRAVRANADHLRARRRPSSGTPQSRARSGRRRRRDDMIVFCARVGRRVGLVVGVIRRAAGRRNCTTAEQRGHVDAFKRKSEQYKRVEELAKKEGEGRERPTVLSIDDDKKNDPRRRTEGL
ncbi:hypothetical protein AAT19DRAFT_11048 [Rhodotorula toruloides]|uniref:Uncharacterized protein n=1 Tax=Rhodotorula toruloides TaxID=5286 RepID=A0A2S9ZYS3_RHOTO|nr:hypothetical protein AAT19DRAFT_11048 [Rhodotorula toruloides]